MADGPQSRATVPRRPVVVIGSANVDVSVTTPVLPRPGETVEGESSLISVGGKGANQAAAAALMGATVEFIGCTGADAFGTLVREALAARGVGLSRLDARLGQATGLAAIYVEHSGQNCIVVVPGANASLGTAEVDSAAGLIARAALVVLQREVPPATVAHAVEVARRQGVPVLLNPAPCRGLTLDHLPRGLTCLVPNETEIGHLVGATVTTPDEAIAAAARVRERGVEWVVVTLGASGCVVADAAGARHYPAPPVAVVDTTGAGDAFIGCLAAALAAGRARDEAVRRALLYASLTTTRRGALASYGDQSEFERAWAAGPGPTHPGVTP